mmetsp:Transcript_38838/g.89846  ORF Transcript_38838/g.89846 Transcript_38838/m.89846 type:complete len:209 (+) Transcript_38838:874-1500(+)
MDIDFVVGLPELDSTAAGADPNHTSLVNVRLDLPLVSQGVTDRGLELLHVSWKGALEDFQVFLRSRRACALACRSVVGGAAADGTHLDSSTLSRGRAGRVLKPRLWPLLALVCWWLPLCGPGSNCLPDDGLLQDVDVVRENVIRILRFPLLMHLRVPLGEPVKEDRLERPIFYPHHRWVTNIIVEGHSDKPSACIVVVGNKDRLPHIR